MPQILRLPWRSAVSPSVPRLNRRALKVLEPQRSALVLVVVLSQVCYDHLAAQRARLGLGLIAGLLRSSWSWSRAPLEVRLVLSSPGGPRSPVLLHLCILVLQRIILVLNARVAAVASFLIFNELEPPSSITHHDVG